MPVRVRKASLSARGASVMAHRVRWPAARESGVLGLAEWRAAGGSARFIPGGSYDHWLLPGEAALGLLSPSDLLDLERRGLDRGECPAVWPATTDCSSDERRYSVLPACASFAVLGANVLQEQKKPTWREYACDLSQGRLGVINGAERPGRDDGVDGTGIERKMFGVGLDALTMSW
jgi:hypothetical protein